MISQVARVEVRATVFGSFAAVAAISSVAGPLLGGKEKCAIISEVSS